MIYFIATSDRQFCKIGKAIAPHDRLAALQTGCPFELELLATRAEPDAFERQCHRHFADRRHFREWFSFDAAMLEEFLALRFDPKLMPEKLLRAPIDMLDGMSIEEFRAGISQIENSITRLLMRIRLAVAEGESPASFARKAGLHRNAIYGCQRPDWNPKADTLRKLEQILPAES